MQEAERKDKPPRSDLGTIILHWTTAIAFVVSLFTGIRMAAFGHVLPGLSRWLSPIMPQGEMWTWHFFTGLGLFFCASAYLIYLNRGGLTPRNAVKKVRVALMPVASKMRWQAVNVGLHWFIYVLITVMMVTGVILYLGYGGWWVWVHSISAFIGFGYIFLHVITHYLFGGWWQLFRLFRPTQLVITRAVRPYPLLIASGIGVATTGKPTAIFMVSRFSDFTFQRGLVSPGSGPGNRPGMCARAPCWRPWKSRSCSCRRWESIRPR